MIGALIGWLFTSGKDDRAMSSKSDGLHESHVNQTWTCSMHPQIQQPEPGQCPICGMDLIPLKQEGGTTDPMEIKMSPTAMQLASVITSAVTKGIPAKEVLLNGKVEVDETAINAQVAHVPGRIERLLVNYTGERVTKGQVLAYVYSPELITAQKELFEARKVQLEYPELYTAAKEKLKNWKLSDHQIQQLSNSDQLIEQFPIIADHSGIVINRKVSTGDYISTGKVVFELANLETVWVMLDIYEKDLQWVKVGDDAQLNFTALPGQQFKGNIQFIDPVVDPKSRVAKARIVMANKSGHIKPEMLAKAKVMSLLDDQSEVVQVPKTAVMWTGKRSVIYVKRSSVDGVGFIMREVTLGPDMGDAYIVLGGIDAGEEIAVSGTFSIDAAAQLVGKPSMMNPEGGKVMTGHNHGGASSAQQSDKAPQQGHSSHQTRVAISGEARDKMLALLSQYMSVKEGLVNDDYELSMQSVEEFKRVFSTVNMSLFKGKSHAIWMEHRDSMIRSLNSLDSVKSIQDVREIFSTISDNIIPLVKTFGTVDSKTYVQFCPMANNNSGGRWLSLDKTIANPFYGSAMLKCGEIKESINPK